MKKLFIALVIIDILTIAAYAGAIWKLDTKYHNPTYATETRYVNVETGEIMYDPGYIDVGDYE